MRSSPSSKSSSGSDWQTEFTCANSSSGFAAAAASPATGVTKKETLGGPKVGLGALAHVYKRTVRRFHIKVKRAAINGAHKAIQCFRNIGLRVNTIFPQPSAG